MLPRPVFSKDNPYWLKSPYKRNTGQDYAFSWVWELRRRLIDPKMMSLIRLMRGPLWKLVSMFNFREWWRGQTKQIVRAVRTSREGEEPLRTVHLSYSGKLNGEWKVLSSVQTS